MSINQAFGISEDDIMEVLDEEAYTSERSWQGKTASLVTDEDLTKWMGALDHDVIAHAALYFTDLDEQTDAARGSIDEQLRAMGVYEELEARLSSQQMQEQTKDAHPASPIPRP